jgi:hypothetical protein
MATSIWDVDGHCVSLTHGFWSGAASITVDERLVFERPTTLFDCGFVHRIEIEGKVVAVRVVSDDGVRFRHELLRGFNAEPNALPQDQAALNVSRAVVTAALVLVKLLVLLAI